MMWAMSLPYYGVSRMSATFNNVCRTLSSVYVPLAYLGHSVGQPAQAVVLAALHVHRSPVEVDDSATHFLISDFPIITSGLLE